MKVGNVITMTQNASGVLKTLEGTGSKDLKVNGSITPVEFMLPIDTVNGYDLILDSIRVTLNASSKLASGNVFLNFLTALTNGINYGVKKSDGSIYLANRDPIKSNMDMFARDYLNIASLEFVGNDVVISFTISPPKPLAMSSNSISGVVLYINDDLSTLVYGEAFSKAYYAVPSRI